MNRLFVVAAAAALFATVAPAQDAPKPVVEAQVQTKSKDRVSGKLLALDGKTAWAGRMVRVTPVGKTATFGVLTNREGAFTLPKLVPGKYLVRVGKLIRTLEILKDKPLQPLVLLGSRDVIEAESIPMGQAVAPAGGGSAIFVIGGISVAGVLGGVGFVAYERDRARHDENQNERRDFRDEQDFQEFLRQNNLSFTRT